MGQAFFYLVGACELVLLIIREYLKKNWYYLAPPWTWDNPSTKRDIPILKFIISNSQGDELQGSITIWTPHWAVKVKFSSGERSLAKVIQKEKKEKAFLCKSVFSSRPTNCELCALLQLHGVLFHLLYISTYYYKFFLEEKIIFIRIFEHKSSI